jgi:serine/threonine protein kinase/N-acetylneuraminic acid mutarotase
MLRCLNPKKAHENRGSFARPVPSGKTLALSATSSSEVRETGEEQVACQYCKYLLAEAVLGDCRIIRWIGSGAFGDVYEAEQLPPLSRRVAIKVMAIERVVDGESAEMFAREVNTIAALDHPHILPVLRVGMIDDGRPYLVMKYAAQGSLQQFCQPASPSFITPSLVPTLKHTNIAETPADALAIVSAETLKIVETIENTAHTREAENDEDSVKTASKAHSAHEEQNLPTTQNAQSAPEDDAHAAATRMHTSRQAPHRDDSAHQETYLDTSGIVVPEAESTSPKISEAEANDAEPICVSSDEAIATCSAQTPALNPVVEALAAPGDVDPDQNTNMPSTDAGVATLNAVDDADHTQPAPNMSPASAGAEALESADNAEAEQGEQTPVVGAVTEALVESDEVEASPDAQTLACTSDAEQTLKSTREQQANARDGEARGSSAIAQQGKPHIEQQNGDTRAQETEQISTIILTGNAQPAATPAALQPLPAGRVIPLSLQQVLGYLEEAASALSYAHQRGLIHLDVKPANLLLDAEGRLLLADFGVSVLLEGYTHASLHYYVGTPLYTAPEQWLEQPRTASDQYALAVTCYQLLTGRAPFTGNLYAVMHGHLQATPPPMYEFNPLIPAQIEVVLRRALAKDPVDRYPDILAFARAFREAVETAAGADTDTQMQQRAALLLEPSTPVLLSQDKALPAQVADDNAITAKTASKKAPPEPGTFHEKQAEWELPGDRLHAGRGRWLRNLVLCGLALLLIAGGSLGFVRSQRPCWLGICPQILLSTNAITLTNSGLQPIEITNTGTDSLHWTASLHPLAPWLSLSATHGILAPGHSNKLILQTNVDSLNQSGVYTDMISIYGGPGVATQAIEVTENVAKGLSAVSVNTSGQSFLYEQNRLQPGKQKITITNRSGHTLNWFTQYTDNNWLLVTPSQGSLKNNQSIELTATVENPQTLANDTYQVRFSLVGQLDNQANPTLLQTINFSLQVNQSQTAQVAPTAAPSSPIAPPGSPSFTAQSVQASGAPGVQRFNHSMVWNTQDDQLFIFGGRNAQGGLLNDLWSYNPANNSWTQLTSAAASNTDCSDGQPSPRMSAAMVWDNVDQEVLLYGGIGRNNSYLGDLWAYSPAKDTWSALACSGNGPGARAEAGVAWNGSQMLLLGGLGAHGSLGDFWAYTPGSDGGWNQISANTPLGARVYPAISWDARDKQLYVFGGLGASGQPLGDFYSYQPDSGWSTITARNNASPMARQQALCTWDSKNNIFLLMDGWQASTTTTYSALWAYSPANNTWWQITSLGNNGPTSVIPSRMASVMVWDNDDNRAYIYAGSSGVNKGALNDLWIITPG